MNPTTPIPSSAKPDSPLAALRAQVALLHEGGAPGEVTARTMADGVDRLVRQAFDAASARGAPINASLLATGGYGRGELAPWSDVDLLLLVPDDTGEAGEALARELFTALWDAGLEPGTALRTERQALEACEADHTVATALLDGRHLAGDEGRSRQLLRAYGRLLQGERLEGLLRAKVEERRTRHQRFGGSVYLLEPNLKTSPGGLRDLATGLWLARARHLLEGLGGLETVAHYALLPRDELERLRRARSAIWRLRCAVHLMSRRRDDRLTFSAQERAAAALGYADEAQALGVERLMRDYYLAARVVEHATDALEERCGPGVVRRGPRVTVALDGDFDLFDGRVTFGERAELSTRPQLLVELFVAAERAGLPVDAGARERVAAVVAREDARASLAGDGPAMRAFLHYLTLPGARGEALQGMYRTGLLGALFPQLARLQARVQHDVYHVYTVDTHSVFALERLMRLRAGLMAAEQPVFTRLAQGVARPLALLLGMLFHDLGKGLGGDHSARGEELLRGYAAQLPWLDGAVVEDAAFLVREHLKLSQWAFRRDLSDPALLERVAALVGGRDRLEMLYLLTYADIASVGPETWNEWRARLLDELFSRTRTLLAEREGDGRVTAGDRTEAAVSGAAELRRLLPAGADGGRFVEVLPERYLATVAPTEALRHYELWQRARGRQVLASIHEAPGLADAGALVVVTDDRPGLLALLAGVLSAHSIDILSAEIYSLGDGRALDVFVVREPGGAPPSAERCAAFQADVVRVLDGQEEVPALLARRRGARWAVAGGPAVATKVRFDPDAARDATVVDIFAQDRPGLLYDIATALREAGAGIVLARVATEGNRAIDCFYLQDGAGMKLSDTRVLESMADHVRRRLSESSAREA